MRTITVEEHFASPGFLDGPGSEVKDRAKAGGRFAGLLERLTDIGAGRIAAMDAAGIDVQVLSLTAPGLEQSETAEALALARESNDYLAAGVKKNPMRFAGLASLPIGAPDKAAEELERRVRQDGFKGAIINGHNRGRYLDDKFFWPILERAEALGVPIYLHPTRPPKAVMAAQFDGFSPPVNEAFSGPGWGWHIETALHIIRLILGGAFDRYPKLQIATGHLGEGLIGLFQRFDFSMPPAMTKLDRPVSAYLRDNVHYSFSGFNFPATFLALLLEVGVERIMFSADHPYQSMKDARAFLEQIPVSAADRERIAHGNAEKLFNL
jgi:predicted TIM-barrel fold metal-dependent hydrolase